MKTSTKKLQNVMAAIILMFSPTLMAGEGSPSIMEKANALPQCSLNIDLVGNCGDTAQVHKNMYEKYGELLQVVANVSDQKIIETYANPDTRSWTVVVTSAGSKSCVFGGGSEYKNLSKNSVDRSSGSIYNKDGVRIAAFVFLADEEQNWNLVYKDLTSPACSIKAGQGAEIYRDNLITGEPV